MKKLVALFLALCMVFTLGSVAMAENAFADLTFAKTEYNLVFIPKLVHE